MADVMLKIRWWTSNTEEKRRGIMLKIGVFSNLSRISIRMLRYYDEAGLLKPAHIDQWTNYRYYDEQQLKTANHITLLRDMGFGVAAISELLHGDAVRMEQALVLHRTELIGRQRELQQQLTCVEHMLRRFRKESVMHHTIICKTLPERYVASVRGKLPTYYHEGRLWHTLMKETKPLHIELTEPRCSVGVYHNAEEQEQEVDVEIQLTVQGRYEDTEHIHFYTVPSALIASATYTGSYEQISEVNTEILTWAREHGYEMDGLPFCIYHVGPNDTQNPDELVTEVCLPVRKKTDGTAYTGELEPTE